MAKVSTEVKELRAYVKGQEKQIEDQRKAMDNMHKTILEDIKKIELLGYQNKEYESVIHFLLFECPTFWRSKPRTNGKGK